MSTRSSRYRRPDRLSFKNKEPTRQLWRLTLLRIKIIAGIYTERKLCNCIRMITQKIVKVDQNDLHSALLLT